MGDEETRENEIEFISYGKTEKVEGRVWWNGTRVVSDSRLLLSRLRDLTIVRRGEGNVPQNLTIDDGVDFLEGLPARFRSYLTARKV
jgi:hypothetical protein